MSMSLSGQQRTLVILKPDAVQRALVGLIIKRIERRGYSLVAIKSCRATADQLHTHYAALQGMPFYDDLIRYMQSGPIICMVWQGADVVANVRHMVAGDGTHLLPGTIRADFGTAQHHGTGSRCCHNVCHASDDWQSAKEEMTIWFDEQELPPLE